MFRSEHFVNHVKFKKKCQLCLVKHFGVYVKLNNIYYNKLKHFENYVEVKDILSIILKYDILPNMLNQTTFFQLCKVKLKF